MKHKFIVKHRNEAIQENKPTRKIYNFPYDLKTDTFDFSGFVESDSKSKLTIQSLEKVYSDLESLGTLLPENGRFNQMHYIIVLFIGAVLYGVAFLGINILGIEGDAKIIVMFLSLGIIFVIAISIIGYLYSHQNKHKKERLVKLQKLQDKWNTSEQFIQEDILFAFQPNFRTLSVTCPILDANSKKERKLSAKLPKIEVSTLNLDAIKNNPQKAPLSSFDNSASTRNKYTLVSDPRGNPDSHEHKQEENNPEMFKKMNISEYLANSQSEEKYHQTPIETHNFTKSDIKLSHLEGLEKKGNANSISIDGVSPLLNFEHNNSIENSEDFRNDESEDFENGLTNINKTKKITVVDPDQVHLTMKQGDLEIWDNLRKSKKGSEKIQAENI